MGDSGSAPTSGDSTLEPRRIPTLFHACKKDSYPLPCMQETMESMVGAQFFSTMDLKSGFWQVKMAEKPRHYTAFTVRSMGIFEFLQMPYRLCNAPYAHLSG